MNKELHEKMKDIVEKADSLTKKIKVLDEKIVDFQFGTFIKASVLSPKPYKTGGFGIEPGEEINTVVEFTEKDLDLHNDKEFNNIICLGIMRALTSLSDKYKKEYDLLGEQLAIVDSEINCEFSENDEKVDIIYDSYTDWLNEQGLGSD